MPASPPVGGFAAPVKSEATDTTSVRINPSNGRSASSSKSFEVPQGNWSAPVTLVESQKPMPNASRAVVTYVGDGDSFNVKRSNGKTIECRIDSFDAPETLKSARDGRAAKPGQPFGEDARELLRGMIERKEVTVKVTKLAGDDGTRTKENNYGRSFCQVEIQGQNIDKELLRQGAAWIYDEIGKPVLAQAVNEARVNKQGLWADPNPEKPWAYRKRVGN